MRASIVWTLFQKELLEIIRDRRTLLVMILMPLLLYPMFGILGSQATVAQQTKIRKSRYKIGTLGQLKNETLVKHLLKKSDIQNILPSQDWKKLLQTGKVETVLKVVAKRTKAKTRPQKQGASSQIAQSRPTTKTSRPSTTQATSGSTSQSAKTESTQKRYLLYYVSTRSSSRAAHKRVKKALHALKIDLLNQRLQSKKIPKEWLHPVVYKTFDVVSNQGKGRYLLSRMLPILMILMTVMGAFYPAVELTAGEKERGTLETLLTAPVTSLEIVAGKYLTVTSIAMITGSLNLFSLWLTFSHGIRLAGRTSSFQFGIQPWQYLASFGLLFLVAALSSALMIVVASLARSFKEGQNYVTPVYLACMLPGMVTALPGWKATIFSATIPMVNVAFAIQQAINGDLSLNYLLMTLASMSVFIILALILAGKIFEHEQALFHEGDFSFRSILKRPKETRMFPSLGQVGITISIQFLLVIYVAATLQKYYPALGLLFTLWGIFFLTPIVMSYLGKMNFRETFRLKAFSPKTLPGILLMVLGAIPLVLAITNITNQWIPGWEQYLKNAEKVFSAEHFGSSQIVFIFILAISPGICEELTFRGFTQSALQKISSPKVAIFFSAILFGAFHLSIYRFLPTTLLGIMMGWLCYRTGSIFPAMLAHALNNGLAVGLNQLKASYDLKNVSQGGLPVWTIALAILILALGILIVHTYSPPQEKETL